MGSGSKVISKDFTIIGVAPVWRMPDSPIPAISSYAGLVKTKGHSKWTIWFLYNRLSEHDLLLLQITNFQINVLRHVNCHDRESTEANFLLSKSRSRKEQEQLLKYLVVREQLNYEY